MVTKERVIVTIYDHYRAQHPRSQALYTRAQAHFPGGITHDGRWMEPFPLAIERAAGAYKWDADGHRLIDYWQGHGALLLGHAPALVVEALQRQAALGTHYGGNHALEVEWAEQVKRCFPHLEQLRFTASGTEATMLALRLARAHTNKPIVIRLAGHFHGWHDLLAFGIEGDDLAPPGILPGIINTTLVVPATIEAVEQAAATRDDIAALILEPSGTSYGKQPLPADFLQEVRALCTRHGILMICDEVVTGFRVAPGGVQQCTGVEADLTCLAKILAGGLPGGAVGGRAEIMRRLAFGDGEWNTRHKIRHQGTYNANPMAASAGIATLEQVRTGMPQERATDLAGRLRAGINAELQHRGLRGCTAYGDSSIVHVLLGSTRKFAPGTLPDNLPLAELKNGAAAPIRQLFRLAMLNDGVDFMRGTSAFVSTAHTEEDIATTVSAFGGALDLLRGECAL